MFAFFFLTSLHILLWNLTFFSCGQTAADKEADTWTHFLCILFDYFSALFSMKEISKELTLSNFLLKVFMFNPVPASITSERYSFRYFSSVHMHSLADFVSTVSWMCRSVLWSNQQVLILMDSSEMKSCPVWLPENFRYAALPECQYSSHLRQC